MSKPSVPAQIDWPANAIFSLGHSTLHLEEFIALVSTYGVKCIADVRKMPGSRRNPQFNDDTLSSALQSQDIGYVHFPGLGGLRRARKDSPNTGWRNASFRGYADYMQTHEFAHGLDELIALSRTRRTAIMCAEAVPWRCHRSLVADALTARNIPVIEILSQSSYQSHQLTAFARIQGDSITYPPEQGSLF